MGELKGNAIYMNLIKPFASIHERGNIKMSLVFVCIRPSAIYQIECANMKKTHKHNIFGKLLNVLLQYCVGKITVIFALLAMLHSL